MFGDTVRILLVDDHELVRRSVSSLLAGRLEFEVVGEASDGPEGVQRAQDLQPDIVVLDITMPTMNGLEVSRRIAQVAPLSKIIFLSQHNTGRIISEAFSTGARGYVLKSDIVTDLVRAVQTVGEGKKFLSHSLASLGPLPSPPTAN